MRIATWNINGVKARLDTATRWLAQAAPDLVCLQETKSADEAFPREPFEDLGYNLALHGRKGFNGVALLSKRPLDDVSRGLPGDDTDEQPRFVEAIISIGEDALRIASIYLPNGNPVGTEKYEYKLRWIDRLIAWTRSRLAADEAFVIAGDFNVIPHERDVRFPDAWTEDALFRPESRRAWRRLINLGLTDAFRAVNSAGDQYTFWDYQAGAWQKNNGIRIDHFLMSPKAADRLSAVAIDKRVRGWDKPSDHVPVIAELATDSDRQGASAATG